MAGPPSSAYSPRLARSDTVRMPIRADIGGIGFSLSVLIVAGESLSYTTPRDSRSFTSASTHLPTGHSCVGSTRSGLAGGS
jgi:hypothetical protein